MNKINIQEILPFVEMPSRYLGCEANSIKKELSKVDLKFALAFPDLYEIGTSHFGMQILYTILNQQKNIAAERFFTPAPDMEKILREKKLPLFSLESEIDLNSFDIVGFSLLYELNFTNILTMLSLSGIPFYSSDRECSAEEFPLIIAGGPCAFNPEPLADFFDAFVIGDGEEVVLEISTLFIQWKNGGSGDRRALLKSLSEIEGVYVPSFFKACYNEKGVQHLLPLEAGYERIKRAILPDINSVKFPTEPIVPFGKPVHDRLRLEIARGCSRGCRFCQAGMIYRPVRERSVEDLVEIAKIALKKTGYRDLSLLSLSTGDYSDLAHLMEDLMAIDPGHCISISLPSVRAGKLNAPLMKIIKKVKKTGFTIAPEAGTQRLRDVINKNITQDDIFNTVTSAFELGWRNIKLYFMNGLPTETPEDIQAIADMAKQLAGIKIHKGKSTISISFATFIPKAHTPFQRAAQIDPDKALANLNFLKQNVRHPGINLKWQNPKMSLLEGVWARGDRRLSKVLVRGWEKGCRLDGWSDMFRFDLWQEAFDECAVDPLFYTVRRREEGEVLPWSHIDCGISDQFMESELDRAMRGELTPDCREHGCTGCGICDFKTVQPLLYPASNRPDLTTDKEGQTQNCASLCKDSDKVADSELPLQLSNLGKEAANGEKSAGREDSFSKLTIFYSKLGKARHFGHLELAKIIRRAIRRTAIKVKYSTGFSPAMKVSFDNPLPVGMESEEEFFTIHAQLSSPLLTDLNPFGEDNIDQAMKSEKRASEIKPDQLVAKLNEVLPRSITVTRCIPSSTTKRDNSGAVLNSYRINLKTFSITQQAVDEFMSLSEYVVDKLSFKGVERRTDLRKVTKGITLLFSAGTEAYSSERIKASDLTEQSRDDSAQVDRGGSTQLEITLENDGQRTIRPSEILTDVFHVPDDVLHGADTLKLKQNKPIKQVKTVC